MRKSTTALVLAGALALAHSPRLGAGGALETIDITGNIPSPIPGQVEARVIGIKWDVRSIPVRYSLNNTLDPVPNALGAPFLTLAAAQAAFASSFNRWNNIPTSFIRLEVSGTTSNPGVRGFDFVNELTFRTAATFTAIASSPSTTLIADSEFIDGDDVDGDGDSDVSSSIATASDVDSDGDIEFPAGFYKAGTILDNDVQFNTKASNGYRFTVSDADLDTVTRSVDLECVAVHEFGHSFGLSHELINQISAADPTGVTMFPFIDTGDPASELSGRTPEIDDIAWASYFYPEGTASTGLAALQPGDVPFGQVFGLITGRITHGLQNAPLAGAHVFARGWTTGATGVGAFSGATRLSYDPATGGLFFVNRSFNIVNGDYVIPTPKGSYAVGVEPVDGGPVPAASVSFTAQIGAAFGQMDFNEEFWNNNKEETLELRAWQAKNASVDPGKVKAEVNVTTTRAVNISNFGPASAIGFVNSPPGRYYAVRVPASQVLAVTAGAPFLVHGGLFDTYLVDASTPSLFSEAMLTTGTVNASLEITSLDLANPLTRAAAFLGQDGDFAPLFEHNPQQLGRVVKAGLEDGSIQNLFLVLRIPTSTPYPGVSGQPPLVGLNTGTQVFGLSYFSNDGVTWVRRTDLNIRFSLVLSEVTN
jgi:hypothetical protein